ncbi:MAG TPA: hypothetical protein VFA11_03815 [Acidimicrobiales bacterium]|nr:hypothetical protein [Acidimicrobiales bacterium]
MYLFSRSARLTPGSPREQIEWAMHITEKVNQISEPRFQLWSRVFSPGFGTFAWTTVCQDLMDLENAETKLMLDDGYLGLAEHGARYVSAEGINDGLVYLSYVDPDAATIHAEYSVLNTMQAAPGCMSKVLELGPIAAQRVRQVTGAPTVFGSGVTGPAGAVGVIALFESLTQLQAAGDAVRADTEFAAFVDGASDMFVPGSATQTITRRLA